MKDIKETFRHLTKSHCANLNHMGKTRFQKIEDKHLLTLSDGKQALAVGLHIIHEVTSAQAFSALQKMGIDVHRPQNTFAVTDHVVNTGGSSAPNDLMDDILIQTLADNCRKYGITLYSQSNSKQGICHVVAPDVGLTRPNTTIFCGDSHTSTHGAFGSIAAGIGTSNVRDILATGCLLNYTSPKQMEVRIEGDLDPAFSAKDIILYTLYQLGNDWATGGAVFFTGSTMRALSMAERMTICNMTIEMGGRFGYCDVDETTVNWYRQKRDFWNPDQLTSDLIDSWTSSNTDSDAIFDKSTTINAADIQQMISYGLTLNEITTAQGKVGKVNNVHSSRKRYEMDEGTHVHNITFAGAFIGSCTNGRYEDFKRAADILKNHGGKVKVKTALAVPGSVAVKEQCEAEGIHRTFIAAGYEWRDPGCSSCLAMNPDKFIGRVASSTNRNFSGRQGPQSRTYLMSPESVALSSLEGRFADIKAFKKKHQMV